MTNKLPEIGKRYKTLRSDIIKIENYGIYYRYEGNNTLQNSIDYNFYHAFRELEELPDKESAKLEQLKKKLHPN